MDDSIRNFHETIKLVGHFEPVRFGRAWKFKTPHGIETRKTKKAAMQAAIGWRDIYNNQAA